MMDERKEQLRIGMVEGWNIEIMGKWNGGQVESGNIVQDGMMRRSDWESDGWEEILKKWNTG